MKIITIIIRTVLGLLFLYTSVSYFLYLSPEPASTGIQSFQVGLMATFFYSH
jgi:hypothetical protein